MRATIVMCVVAWTFSTSQDPAPNVQVLSAVRQEKADRLPGNDPGQQWLLVTVSVTPTAAKSMLHVPQVSSPDQTYRLQYVSCSDDPKDAGFQAFPVDSVHNLMQTDEVIRSSTPNLFQMTGVRPPPPPRFRWAGSMAATGTGFRESYDCLDTKPRKPIVLASLVDDGQPSEPVLQFSRPDAIHMILAFRVPAEPKDLLLRIPGIAPIALPR